MRGRFSPTPLMEQYSLCLLQTLARIPDFQWSSRGSTPKALAPHMRTHLLCPILVDLALSVGVYLVQVIQKVEFAQIP